jgi:hypothetical protein
VFASQLALGNPSRETDRHIAVGRWRDLHDAFGSGNAKTRVDQPSSPPAGGADAEARTPTVVRWPI